ARRATLKVNAPDQIPPEWEETVAACLAKKPEDRPRTAAEVAARLGLTVAGTTRFIEPQSSAALGSAGIPGSSSAPTERPAAKRPRRWIGVAAIGCAATVAVATALWFRAEKPEPTEPVVGANAKGAAAVPTPPVAPVPQFVIKVDPPDAGARVWLGQERDKAVGVDGTIALAALADGEHELTVQASGYQTYTGRVSVANG